MIDPQSDLAGGKARRVYLALRGEIDAGKLGPGMQLSGEQKLAERFGVSRVTVRRALDALVAEGLVQKRVGAGTVVTSASDSDPALTADLTAPIPQIVEMGRKTSARLISFGYATPTPAVASVLGLGSGERVQTAVRVRSLDGRPFSHLTTHVPEAIAAAYTETDLATSPLFELLERSGVRIGAATQSVSATLAAPEVAEALEVPVGAALLTLRRIVHDDEGRGVEYLSAQYRPDLFRIEMTLNRTGNGDKRHWEPVLGGARA